jgi:[acyl-carrier-protein] S-malonyltransferase
LALLFSGQGQQHPDMLRWLDDEPAAEPALAALTRILGAGWRGRLADGAWTFDNRVAQCLVAALSAGAWQGLLAHGLPSPRVVAGYSVGELPAFHAAGVFDFEALMRLATARAGLMSQSVAGQHTGLLAVQGLPAQQVERIARQHLLALAIELEPQRRVLGGLDAALAAAALAVQEAGGHASRLSVPLASHTPWMGPAAAAFERLLDAEPFMPPGPRLVCNLCGTDLKQPAALRKALAGQLDHPLRWASCMDAIAECGVRCVIEVGPGNALSRLWNECQPGAPARSVDEFRSAAAVRRWVASVLAG